MELTKKVWVIMSKDRKRIAKGRGHGSRALVSIDSVDQKDFLTYKSKAVAEVVFKKWRFFDQSQVEAVECELTIKTI